MDPAPAREFNVKRRRLRFLGLTFDDAVKYFFGGNAVVSVVVLALITIFLFREGVGFIGQNHRNLLVYRRAGLEFVDLLREEANAHTALNRALSDLRLREYQYLVSERRRSPAEAGAALAAFDAFAARFDEAVVPLRGMVSDLTEAASEIKTKFLLQVDKQEERRQLLAEGRTREAGAVSVAEVDSDAELKPLLATLPALRETNRQFAKDLETALASAPALSAPGLQEKLARFQRLARTFVASLSDTERQAAAWDSHKPVGWWESFTSFLFGREWLTASFWQDWYGVIPLVAGSVMVSLVALVIAVPLGVGAALYVNQVATPFEQRFIKPCIEFISAFPSVVLGFFGIAVLGEALRGLSRIHGLSWVPGFPLSERLNILTAGSLLALIAIPTIFTLAEDALNNVPRAFKEASLALGATQLQTLRKIIVPAALSGIVSAILLGFGRVIGETMIVLLCAGNRIAIPDFTAGLGVFTQPVHTMTGLIAQEMGEVVRGSIHYRALFMVGILLFFLSLLINYLAQGILRRYRING